MPFWRKPNIIINIYMENTMTIAQDVKDILNKVNNPAPVVVDLAPISAALASLQTSLDALTTTVAAIKADVEVTPAA